MICANPLCGKQFVVIKPTVKTNGLSVDTGLEYRCYLYGTPSFRVDSQAKDCQLTMYGESSRQAFDLIFDIHTRARI